MPVASIESQTPTASSAAQLPAASSGEMLLIPKEERITLNASCAMPPSSAVVSPPKEQQTVLKVEASHKQEVQEKQVVDKKLLGKSGDDDKVDDKGSKIPESQLKDSSKAEKDSITDKAQKEISKSKSKSPSKDNSTTEKPVDKVKTDTTTSLTKQPSPSSEQPASSGDVSGVNVEHSYVKVGAPESVDIGGKAKNAEIELIQKDEELLRTPDGQIHGVGLTPPPDAEIPGIVSLEEDDQQVSNVVIVAREEESKDKVTVSVLEERSQTSGEKEDAENPEKEAKKLVQEEKPSKAISKESENPGEEKEQPIGDKTKHESPKADSQPKEIGSELKSKDQAEIQKAPETVITSSPNLSETAADPKDTLVETKVIAKSNEKVQQLPTQDVSKHDDSITSSLDIPSPKMPVLDQCPHLSTDNLTFPLPTTFSTEASTATTNVAQTVTNTNTSSPMAATSQTGPLRMPVAATGSVILPPTMVSTSSVASASVPAEPTAALARSVSGVSSASIVTPTAPNQALSAPTVTQPVLQSAGESLMFMCC